LPVLTLSLVGVAPIAMYTRNELVEVLSSDYILFAKARGESGWPLIERQALRNILLPALTLQFLSFSELFGGAVLVEQVFSYPGIGQTAVAAGLQSDVPLLLGIVLISAIFVFVGNLIADILYYFVDPRIKENESFDVKY
ncbi:MAG: ABC transporter permease, partial [Methanobrevibacter sp.]